MLWIEEQFNDELKILNYCKSVRNDLCARFAYRVQKDLKKRNAQLNNFDCITDKKLSKLEPYSDALFDFKKMRAVKRAALENKISSKNNHGWNFCKSDLKEIASKADLILKKEFGFLEPLNKFYLIKENDLLNVSYHADLARKIANENYTFISLTKFKKSLTQTQRLLKVFEHHKNIFARHYLTSPLSGNCSIEEIASAVLKMQSEDYILKRIEKLHLQFIEHSQIVLGRVGARKNQNCYISKRAFDLFAKKRVKQARFLEDYSIFNEDTFENYSLADVAKKSVSNPEIRRIEMIVRASGFEKLAKEKDFQGVFVTWTLPSKYHTSSKKYQGISIKAAHQNLMQQWQLARSRIAKEKLEYFGFRVAEPHKDATPHAHYFLFCAKENVKTLVDILKSVATAEDNHEIKGREFVRFNVKLSDPKKGSATSYIAKYISKNINGESLSDAAKTLSARVVAWASTHRIRQFQQFGGASVTLYRQLRKAGKESCAFDAELSSIYDAADSGDFCEFCKLVAGSSLKINYKEGLNQYDEDVKTINGFSWLDKLVETAKSNFVIIKTKSLAALLSSQSELSWNIENNYNFNLRRTHRDLFYERTYREFGKKVTKECEKFRKINFAANHNENSTNFAVW